MKFRAHAFVLSLFTDFFLAHNSHSAPKAVKVDDVDPAVMAAVLAFLYTGRATLDAHLLPKFKQAARKLRITSLIPGPDPSTDDSGRDAGSGSRKRVKTEPGDGGEEDGDDDVGVYLETNLVQDDTAGPVTLDEIPSEEPSTEHNAKEAAPTADDGAKPPPTVEGETSQIGDDANAPAVPPVMNQLGMMGTQIQDQEQSYASSGYGQSGNGMYGGNFGGGGHQRHPDHMNQ